MTGFLISFVLYILLTPDSLLFPFIKCVEITKKLSLNKLFQFLFQQGRRKLFYGCGGWGGGGGGGGGGAPE